MSRIVTVTTLQKVYRSNADLNLPEFREIVETAGHRLTGRWNTREDCPEIVEIKRESQSCPA